MTEKECPICKIDITPESSHCQQCGADLTPYHLVEEIQDGLNGLSEFSSKAPHHQRPLFSKPFILITLVLLIAIGASALIANTFKNKLIFKQLTQQTQLLTNTSTQWQTLLVTLFVNNPKNQSQSQFQFQSQSQFIPPNNQNETTADPQLQNYTIKPNETLWSIAQKTLGSGYFFPLLVETNPNQKPYDNVGATIHIVDSSSQEILFAAYKDLILNIPQGFVFTYTARPGDTWNKLAQVFLGSSQQANKVKSLNPGPLQGGRRLLIPLVAVHPKLLKKRSNPYGLNF